MELDALNPKIIAFAAKKTVARCRGRRYAASRYTFSPPLRGIMQPSSSHIRRPANERRNPRVHSIKDAPTLPVLLKMDDGVEKMPVPMIRLMLQQYEYCARQHEHGRSHEECCREEAQVPAQTSFRSFIEFQFTCFGIVGQCRKCGEGSIRR